ncbi:MAG: hypothetical protein Q8S14_03005 [Algoriphagus sp.]|jgi:CHASE3 domain sensor protein|uniref:hypothetical protein n=1 Tax=Algoriphagus sp. TaxID=1872435 RepID=UPI00271F072F|nr:hypothetical protein [Algoriphagus sp.]MDO8968350.1 hypothetical protein [Algoriphagus sp.]MDP2043309.1 hypothetical protein [Algoriphagus sp.]MDP3200145.1 hypothetical protein [Algoriphagus sp.]MDP3470818.1 hypothetical protein [Algoriphagus sp.]
MKIKFLILTIFFFGIQLVSFAQCAMCRASVENNVSNGDTSIGAGLNSGILYLFVMPYLLAAVIGYLWYKSAKKKKAKLSLR